MLLQAQQVYEEELLKHNCHVIDVALTTCYHSKYSIPRRTPSKEGIYSTFS